MPGAANRMKSPTPSLESLSTIHADGSRKFVHPSDVRGAYTFWRRLSALALLIVYAALPWIPVNGFPAIFLDVQQRRFHCFGLTLAAQDLWIGFFLIVGLAFLLFFITSLFGRIWCGWTCPYTIFLEHVYRRIERLIDGDGPARRQLEDAPWTTAKIIRRVIKHGLFLLVSALIAHLFLSYFVSLRGLYAMMHQSPEMHMMTFGVVVFLTLTLYFCFSWFREQFCVIMCPYGRLQSALIDNHSVVIGYDGNRGEPRGKSGSLIGDCIDCRRCISVCPTGIDIRNGLQLECIACSACVDACDDVMTKLGKPKGLIRYDSQVGFDGGKTRVIRPRTLFYTCVLLAGAAAFGAATTRIEPLRASVIRMVGAQYYLSNGVVRNQFLVRVINKRNAPAEYKLQLVGDVPPQMQITGNEKNLQLGPMGEEQQTIVLSLPASVAVRPRELKIKVTDVVRGDSVTTRTLDFLGPDPRLTSNVPFDPKDYLQ